MSHLEDMKRAEFERMVANGELDECKHGINEWSCRKCEVELMQNVIDELQRKLEESEGRVQRLSVKYRYEREEHVPKLENIIKHAKYEVEIMNEVLKGEHSCISRKFKTLKDILEGEF